MEEISGDGIKNFDFSVFNSKKGLVLDGAASVGSIITEAPSKYTFNFDFIGVAGHSGVSKTGLSAIVLMANFVTCLTANIKDIKAKINFGKILGGTAINVIPERVVTKGEIRGEDKECQKIINIIKESIIETKNLFPRGKIDFSYELKRKSYSFIKNDPFVSEIKQIMHNNSIKPKEIHSYGVADGNTFNSLGYQGVVLGIGAKNFHTTDEQVDLVDMVKLTEIVIDMCKN